jgi:four helix bundle protein
VHECRKLKVWVKAHQLTLDVYGVSEAFPARERFGLTAQLRRACVSVEANLAEGAGRGRTAQFIAFLEIAAGSLNETDCLLLVCRDLGYLDARVHAPLEERTSEVRRMLFGLLRGLRSDAAR